MDALELSLRCSALLIRSVSNSLPAGDDLALNSSITGPNQEWSEADYEKHFNEHGKLYEIFVFSLFTISITTGSSALTCL